MKKIDIYTAFSETLDSVSNGQDLESCLSLYPEYRDEIKAMVEMAVFAQSVPAKMPDSNSKIRAKNRVMAALAQGEQKKQPKTVWQHGFDFLNVRVQRMALSAFVVVAVLFSSGTGLVQASNGALPGDNLYSVKRSWEGVRLFFVFDSTTKQNLESTFDKERFEEINELYSEGRFEQVSFDGIVEKIDGEFWTISGVVVRVEIDEFANLNVPIGSSVHIIGETDDDCIEVEQLTILRAGESITIIMTPTFLHKPSDDNAISTSTETSDDDSDQEMDDFSTDDSSIEDSQNETEESEGDSSVVPSEEDDSSGEYTGTNGSDDTSDHPDSEEPDSEPENDDSDSDGSEDDTSENKDASPEVKS